MAPQVADYINALIEGGEAKLVVFAWHIQVLDILEAGLAERGWIRVDGRDGAGSVSLLRYRSLSMTRLRKSSWETFSLWVRVRMVLQHVASHGLLAEADWIHGNNEQCADRLDRGGQRSKVQFDIFVAPGSIGEKVLAVALRDARVTTKALDRLPTDAVQFAD